MKSSFLLFAALFASAPARAGSAGANSALFLRSEPTARMFAMGGITTALDNDLGALFLNPAGLGGIPNANAAVSLWTGLDNTSKYNFISTALNAGEWGVFSVSYLGYDSGSEEINELDGSSRQVVLQQDSALALGWGHAVADWLYAGGQIKRVNSKLAEAYSDSAFTYDAGIMLKAPDDGLSLSAGVQNASGGLRYISEADPLPQFLYAGIGAKIRLSEWGGEAGDILLGADVRKPRDEAELDGGMGFEYTWGMLAVRGGIKRVAGELAFTAGGGLKWKGVGFDYGFQPAGALNQTMQKFTLSAAFNPNFFQ
ncbi:MAG: PorV/PorQ family protein [Elusimicrobiales bacterium]|nr:PorV/PorQ family protein [Elusimicrobiales bacterium]